MLPVFTELDEPIRAELFSLERLEQHAESLAAAQIISKDAGEGRALLPRVMENGQALLEYYRATSRAIQEEKVITPAAEWLVDNFFIVEEQLREIRDDLPTGYYKRLPKLASGHLEGYPRVFGIGWAFVAHTDSRFDPDVLRRFVTAYQRVQPLTIGELWAVAISLRIVLVENLRRVAERIVRSRGARYEADALASHLLAAGSQFPDAPASLLRRFEKTPLERAFVVQLILRLRDLDPKVGPILLWLDDRLAAQGTTADELVRAEHQAQAGMTVTVRNIITSMRLTSAFDWREFFESVSLVDAILRDGSNFKELDFSTRDTYRHAIEELSRGSPLTEIDVASRVMAKIAKARAAPFEEQEGSNDRKLDPGYYLISQGRLQFEREIRFHISPRRALLRLYVRAAVPGYLASIAIFTFLLLCVPLIRAWELGYARLYLIFFGVLAAIPASDLAIALINRAVADLFGPRTLPRLRLREGVPSELRTMIVVPVLLTSVAHIREQVEHLEVHYLANPDGDLRFALLSDWVDSDSEVNDEDEELLAAAAEGIARLNQSHGAPPGGGGRFFLFHRKRTWNECQRKWMGWERKRGKLHELNRFLRGVQDTSFLPVGGHPLREIPGVRYVITLDADTRLPRGTVDRLVGTIAHPLNRPKFSESEGRVVEGYSIVQPRVTPSLPMDREASIFQKIFSGPSGIDPYSAAVSDVYQDLFREGSYTGKGIYDIDAFEAALVGKVSDNSLLSHDLFEGIFARAALATDIELIEEFPSHYEASAARQHRWARGDWQLLPWIFGAGRKSRQSSAAVHISAISRWKMIDNLRRTLSAPAMFLTIVLGWMATPASPALWTWFILIMIAIPPLIPFLGGLNFHLRGISKRSYFRGVVRDLWLGVSQFGLTVTFLAFQAWLMVDAILRTLLRMYFTRRNLLEWVTAAQSKRGVSLDILGIYRRMGGGVALGIAALLVVIFARPSAAAVSLPLVILWIAAPAAARWISLPPRRLEAEPLSPDKIRSLRTASRQTWRFFENFVGEEDHFLPPDNFQEDPKPIVAHRTSPTNIGLYLLSNLAACELGWIGTGEMLRRIEETLGTLSRLEMYRGHFYNWYDTRDLRPLDPKYISSVDSGNFAGHVMAVANGCRQRIQAPALDARIFAGVEDAVALLRDSLAKESDRKRTQTVTRKQLENSLEQLIAPSVTPPEDPRQWTLRLLEMSSTAQTQDDIAQALVQELAGAADEEVRIWADAIQDCLQSHFRDAQIIFPWLRLSSDTVRELCGNEKNPSPLWLAIEPLFKTIPSLAEAPDRFEAALLELESLGGRSAEGNRESKCAFAHHAELKKAFTDAAAEAKDLLGRLSRAARTCEKLFSSMDFSFLFDPSRKLFSIGYRATDGTLDSNCYDLLASEARLTSFIAIAKGDVSSTHWYRLGRALTPVGRGSALISWSGSMFEYLMPALVMRSPEGSLLNQTYQQMVRRQIEYGEERGVPWGISECAYNARDMDFTYQYSSFGVPGLGLKRGLSEDLVIAPYATALAAMIDPSAAVTNLVRMEAAGGRGVFGYYEALDYTPSRLPEGKEVAVIRAYMAHHQGMSLLSFANVLTGGMIQRHFHSEPIMQATELLLQERTPRDVLVARPRAEEVSAAAHVRELVPPSVRRTKTPHDTIPRTHLLSNGRYSVMFTAAGSGYSRWRDIAVTRWREDFTRDCWGSYVYLRDVLSGHVWSAGFHPSGAEADDYQAAFFEDHLELVRRDRSLTTTLEIVVSPEDDAEMRRVSITNLGARSRDIEVTSYTELCLAPQAADSAHPAFSNLFVETEFAHDSGMLLATRRKRSAEETSVWAAHVLVVDGQTTGELQYETDRAQFLGRARTLQNPVAMVDGRPLSGTVGSVLDPIFSQRRTVHIASGSTAHLIFSTIVASTREEVLELADKYRDTRTFERTLTLAWTQAQIQLRHLGMTPEEANLFQRLANSVLFSDPSLRPAPEMLRRTSLDISQLWSQGISGDLPIVLARIDDADDVEIIRQLLRAHEYWRMKQHSADVVILNEKAHSYVQELQSSLETLVRGSQLRLPPDTSGVRGKIFLLRSDVISPETRIQLQAAARVVLLNRRGTLSEQIARAQNAEPPASAPLRSVRPSRRMDVQFPQPSLQYFNGLGGFAENGREYGIILSDGLRTPEPWVNVVANPHFGFLVSESGSGFTWSENSHENQLTPWSNDHLFDTCGEAIYIRDESTGEVWTPTAMPIRDEAATYMTRHGAGYSRFQHGSHGILLDLVQFVPPDDPVKISRLSVQNCSNSTRRLSVTAYAEWVLGSSRSASAPYISTEIDAQSGALIARNLWQGEFAGRVAFASLAGNQAAFTADRTEFLGRNGDAGHPAALFRNSPLSGKTGTGLDPCAALQTVLELRPGARAEVVFYLGQAKSLPAAQELIARYRRANLDEVFSGAKRSWDDTLSTVQVSTPDSSMDVMLNGWLLYQTLCCRVWARAAFYQLSGAYGFRDQLQDVMALCVVKRSVAREQLLRAAAHQFVEGDVQHWWHPPSGRGIRSRISDDLLWLPYAVIQFMESTGDMTLLDESVPFLEGDVLAAGQLESYFEPRISEKSATLFEHCARALDRSLSTGIHGIPLMGTGDWNDGMNRVGWEGKGESVWLGWFLHTVMWEFAKIADLRGEHQRAGTWRIHVSAIKAALEKEAWDGEWYRRAYFDDGAPLGSAQNGECRIDSIAQSWGVISGAAEPSRGARAMDSVLKHLVREDDSLVLLLTPPFDRAARDPGYIKGYLPGIRENGGQYTHAATWVAIAFAALGDGDRAWQLFRILNPVNRSSSRSSMQRYKVEPYVIAGDIYAEAPHVGRGGWTWYTGAAGWLYRAGLEWILGFRMRGMTLSIDPCIPRAWPGYSIRFRYHSATYEIKVENPSNVSRGVALTDLDGTILSGAANIPLSDDGKLHHIRVVLG